MPSRTAPTKDIAGKKLTPKSVEGSQISIDATNGVKINNAKVVKADIEASNGVIHVMDSGNHAEDVVEEQFIPEVGGLRRRPLQLMESVSNARRAMRFREFKLDRFRCDDAAYRPRQTE